MSVMRGRLSKESHQYRGMIVSVGNTMLTRTFVNLLLKLYPKNDSYFFMAASGEEAYEIFSKDIHTQKQHRL